MTATHPIIAALGQLSFDTIPYKDYILTIILVFFVWEKYLALRQYRQYKLTKPPAELSSTIKEEDFKKSQRYGADKLVFGALKSFFDLGQTFAFFQYDLLSWAWIASGWVMSKYLGYGAEYEITHSLLFATLFSLFSTITSIPFDLYYNFVLEEKHGFNKLTLKLYVTDTIKQLLISAALGLPFLAAMLWIIKWFGDVFYIYLTGFVMAFQLFIVAIYPNVIQPLFNKLTPVSDQKLKSEIEKLADSVKFPLKKLYVIDGSKRSSHSNAYFSGFGKNKHIVLFDTLIEQVNLQEILAILGHELGHWKLSHLPRMIVVSMIQTFTIFYLFSHFTTNITLYNTFRFGTHLPDFAAPGFVVPNPVAASTSTLFSFLAPSPVDPSSSTLPAHATPTLIGLLLFSYLLTPLSSLFQFLTNVMSRLHEFQADEFAVKLGYASDLKKGLIKIHEKNLSGVWVDRLWSAYYYSHPPLIERLKGMDEAVQKLAQDGKKKN